MALSERKIYDDSIDNNNLVAAWTQTDFTKGLESQGIMLYYWIKLHVYVQMDRFSRSASPSTYQESATIKV